MCFAIALFSRATSCGVCLSGGDSVDPAVSCHLIVGAVGEAYRVRRHKAVVPQVPTDSDVLDIVSVETARPSRSGVFAGEDVTCNEETLPPIRTSTSESVEFDGRVGVSVAPASVGEGVTDDLDLLVGVEGLPRGLVPFDSFLGGSLDDVVGDQDSPVTPQDDVAFRLPVEMAPKDANWTALQVDVLCGAADVAAFYPRVDEPVACEDSDAYPTAAIGVYVAGLDAVEQSQVWGIGAVVEEHRVARPALYCHPPHLTVVQMNVQAGSPVVGGI